MYTDKFDKCIGFVLEHEGDKSNDPNDLGGRTRMGICSKWFKDVVDKIWDLPYEEAKEIAKEFYFKNFWQPLSLDDYDNLRLALAIFDTGVNMGIGIAKNLATQLKNNSPEEYALLRIERYTNIVRKNKTQNVFLLGWTIRALDTIKYRETENGFEK